MDFLPVEKLYERYPKLHKSDVEKVSEWLKCQPHLPKLTELEVAIFVKTANFSVEAAKTRLDNYYSIRTVLSSCFSSRDILGDDVKAMKDVVAHLVLPKRTPEGYKVILHRFLDDDPSKFDFQKFTKMTSFTNELEILKNGPEEGIIFIVDLQGARMGHIPKLNLRLSKQLVYYLTEAFPGEFVQFHYINSVSFMDRVMLLTRQFFKSELMDRVHWHKNSKRLRDFMPLSILPRDYEGGEEEPVKVLWEKYYEFLCEHREYFLEEEKTRRVNESLRTSPPRGMSEVFGLEGSFKKLDID